MECAPDGQECAVATAVGPLAGLLVRERDLHGRELTLPRTGATLLDRIRAVVDELRSDPGLTAREIADRVGLPRRQTVLLLLRLEEHGHVVRDGRCWYAGPDGLL